MRYVTESISKGPFLQKRTDKKEREWQNAEGIQISVLKFLSLEDHLANAGRPLGIMMEVEEIMEEHIIKTHLDEGTLPYEIALLSTKQFKVMKKETLK